MYMDVSRTRSYTGARDSRPFSATGQEVTASLDLSLQPCLQPALATTGQGPSSLPRNLLSDNHGL